MSLTHFNAAGEAHMVDVSEKADSLREAVAEATIRMRPSTFDLIEGGAAKGDVLGVARLAAIMAAKRTADLIPLCHPLPLSKVSVEFEKDSARSAIRIIATVRTTGKTGVEMEALTAATMGALTIYDMLKAAEKGMWIENARLVSKKGGKSGDYKADL